jgi:hypothetical protein
MENPGLPFALIIIFVMLWVFSEVTRQMRQNMAQRMKKQGESINQAGSALAKIGLSLWLFVAALGLLVFVLLGCNQARAASYNCQMARLPAEVAICQDQTLSFKDEVNATIYFSVKSALSGRARATFNQYERSWLARRNACGYDTACLHIEYANHLNYLCELAVAVGTAIVACQELRDVE